MTITARRAMGTRMFWRRKWVLEINISFCEFTREFTREVEVPPIRYFRQRGAAAAQRPAAHAAASIRAAPHPRDTRAEGTLDERPAKQPDDSPARTPARAPPAAASRAASRHAAA